MLRALLLLMSVAAIGMPAMTVHVKAASVAVLVAGDSYAAPIAEAAQRFGIPAAWIKAVMRLESNGDRRAISRKGAMGLMQLMPGTWEALRARYALGHDPFDPHDNILAGAAFLREMHDRYGSPGFLAAYNAGPGRYEDYRDRGRPLPPETVDYIAGLLPFLGNDAGAMPAPTSLPDALAWTHAPIFLVHSSDAPAVDHPSVESTASEPAPVATVHDLSGIVPQSDDLFVAVPELKP